MMLKIFLSKFSIIFRGKGSKIEASTLGVVYIGMSALILISQNRLESKGLKLKLVS